MRRRVTPDDEVAAAYLLAKEKRPQTEIATILGLSAPVVSRLLNRVEGKYFARETRFLTDNVPSADLRAIEERLSRSPLADKLDRVARESCRQPGPSLRIFGTGAPTPADSMMAFAKRIAPFVGALVRQSEVCGVTWGRMLMHVIASLNGLSALADRPIATEFIPLAGEPLGNEPTKSSSSTLASEIGRIMRSEDYHARSLTMVPALVPKRLCHKPQRTVVNELINESKDYRNIFGSISSVHTKSRSTFIDRVDCILSSVGYRPLGFHFGSLLDDSEQNLFLGDVGGVLLPKPSLKKADKRRAAEIIDRWTGLTREHLESCTRRARSAAVQTGERPAGVVLISVGAERASVVLEAVKQGFANHLVIDTALESALTALVDV